MATALTTNTSLQCASHWAEQREEIVIRYPDSNSNTCCKTVLLQ